MKSEVFLMKSLKEKNVQIEEKCKHKKIKKKGSPYKNSFGQYFLFWI